MLHRKDSCQDIIKVRNKVLIESSHTMYITINYSHLNTIVSINLSKIIPQVPKKR